MASQLELSTQWRFWRLSASELLARRTAAHQAALSALSSSSPSSAAADAPSLADALRFVDYYTRRLALMCDVALQLPVGIQVPPPPPPPPPPPRPLRAAAREVLNWGGA